MSGFGIASRDLAPFVATIFRPAVTMLVTGFVGQIAFAQVGQADYLNEEASENYTELRASAFQIADDVHRTSAGDIAGFDLGYYSQAPSPVGLSIFVFRRTILNPPSQADLLRRINLPGLPTGGYEYLHVDLADPLSAPQDIWVGFRFSDPTYSTGLLDYALPTLGFSFDAALVDTNGDGVPDEFLNGDNQVKSFYLGIYSMPEPSSGASGLAITACLCVARYRSNRGNRRCSDVRRRIIRSS